MTNLQLRFRKVYCQLSRVLDKAQKEEWEGATDEMIQQSKATLEEAYKRVLGA